MLRVGDIIYDAEYPDELGFVFKIEPEKPEPYWILYEGRAVRVDHDWVENYCVVLANTLGNPKEEEKLDEGGRLD